MLWALLVSSVILFPYAVVTAPDSEWRASAIIAVIILGVLGTGIVRAMAATLAGRVGGPRMTTTTYLVPVVAIILGVVFRDEVIAPIAIAGVAVVIVAAYWTSRAVAE